MSSDTGRKALHISPKLYFALKTALAVTISYIVAIKMGWSQPYQGPIAIMVIASATTLKESLGKGVMRVFGTIAGAILGLLLIALYPQDTTLYFTALSIVGAIIIYLYYAWQGDKSIWMIMLMVMVLLYNNGEVDDRVIYAIDRSWSTIFGIFVYAMVNIYLMPDRRAFSRIESADSLTKEWQSIAEALKNGKKDLSKRIDGLKAKEKALESSIRFGDTEYPGGVAFDKGRWEILWSDIYRVDRVMEKLSLLEWNRYRDILFKVSPNIEKVIEDIRQSIEEVESFWSKPQYLKKEQKQNIDISRDALKGFDNLQKAHIFTLTEEIRELQSAIEAVIDRLNLIVSPQPTIDETLQKVNKRLRRFIWGDPDHFKSTLTALLIFWSGLAIWFFLNTPQGYTVAAMAFSLSLLIVYTPLNPILLIVVYSFSFLISFVTYVWVLPQLHEWWQLSIYIFLYIFFAYYFIPVILALFFGLGLIFQFIDNSMIFSFQLFVTILLVFYLFLGILLIFNYIPFPNRAEKILLELEERFRRVIVKIANRGIDSKISSPLHRWRLSIIPSTVTKIVIWASKLDKKYFDRVDYEILQEYIKEIKRLSSLALLIEPIRVSIAKSPKLSTIKDRFEILKIDTSIYLKQDIDSAKSIMEMRAKKLDKILQELDLKSYTEDEIAKIAEYITLKKLMEKSLLMSADLREKAGLEQLRWSRF